MTGGHITPDPTADRPLPVQRAFVVQLHATAAVAQGQLSGRVEHVLSGQVAHFRSLDELLAFIARVLTQFPVNPEPASDWGGRTS